MPAVLLDEAAPPVKMAEEKSEKKQKRSKSDHKKRQREDDDSTEPRKHKKSKKQEDTPDATQDVSQEEPLVDQAEVNGETKKKKKKSKKQRESTGVETEAADMEVKEEVAKKSKKKHRKDPEAEQQADLETIPEAPQPEAVEEASESPKKQKKDKSKKKDKKRAESPAPAEEGEVKRKSKKKRKEAEEPTAADDDAMDIDPPQSTTAPTTASKTSGSASDPSFPFYTQTISLYVPFYPVGFDKPITNVAAQHLEPLLNHYSPLLGGVLLAYRNVNLSERPVRPDPKNLPDDHTPALLESVDEYAVGFGWLTADMDLFKPSRGAWMEGTVNLQSEGHIGVVCWNKFNASIEAKRLPAGWKWVDTTKNGTINTGSTGQNTKITFGDDNEDEEAAEAEDNEDEPEKADTDVLDDAPLQLAELHTTGYWVDASGARVSSSPLQFRIKNFDVGIAGDFGYISIEGTTLGDEEERAMGRQEREVEQRRRAKQNLSGLLRPMLRRVPEFSLTSFGREDEEEDSNQKTVIYKGSRPGTPDD